MKTLSAYSSQTGNTKKLADALNRLIGGEKIINGSGMPSRLSIHIL